MNVLHSEQYATVPWRNGGGTTQEVATRRDPAQSDDFLWRVSIATVAAPGPFSHFPEVDRSIALLDGKGMTLCSGAEIVPITPGAEPYVFPGERSIVCRLTDGPTVDLNIMTRRSYYGHTLRREHFMGWTRIVGSSDETLVMANSSLELSFHGRAALRPLDTIAGIRQGDSFDLYSDRSAEIFIIQISEKSKPAP